MLSHFNDVPRWFLLLAVLLGLNGLMVGLSIAQRQLFASENPQQSEEQSTNPTPQPATELPDPQRLKTLDSPELSGSAPSSSIPEDDPLMNEIRKQAAAQFPDVFEPQNSTPPAAPSSPSSAPFASLTQSQTPPSTLHTRLTTIGKLNDAALGLVQLSAQQRELGHHEQAELSLVRVQQLRSLMIELLGE